MFVGEDQLKNHARSTLLAGSSYMELGYGRFMQTDPLGYDDGLNWYNYVDGDPVNNIDTTGLFCANGESGGSEADCAGKGGYIANSPYTQPTTEVTVTANRSSSSNNEAVITRSGGVTNSGTSGGGGGGAAPTPMPTPAPAKPPKPPKKLSTTQCLLNAEQNFLYGKSFGGSNLASKDASRVIQGLTKDPGQNGGLNIGGAASALGGLGFYNFGYYIGRSCNTVVSGY